MEHSILSSLSEGSNPMLSLILLSLACFRVWLELVGFEFEKLPVSRALFASRGNEALRRFHRSGLYFSLGYLLLFAPAILLG